MMRALGIDPMEVETRYETLNRDMQNNCARCTAKDTCRASLAADKAAQEFDRFCANAQDMRWLKPIPAALSD
ncbi:DUF6455 family protein [Rhizobium halophytocola]|uniref:Positive regulator of sigma E activity n=1 Tax=Rhizobium halophytocola TaxID=735519 RepID=A0ABS4DY78_9HYPH|nr:DUF6455 family protein [Rhizobium halophytocola]MBP1850649.1 positive regulator of sigma E activity [Rhizobium halophytocola]